MKRSYLLLKRHGLVFLSFTLLSTALFAAEEKELGVKGISETEFTPAKEVLTVQYVPFNKPYRLNIESLRGFVQRAKAVTIPLQKQDKAFPYGGNAVKNIEVKAAHDGNMICFQVTWKDTTKNARAITVQEFRDAVALMFPLGVELITPAEQFSPRMGDRGKPVNIWHWKADWEADLLTKDELEDMKKRYPNMHDDLYSNPDNLNGCQDLLLHTELLSGGKAAHNLLSDSKRGRSVEDTNAEGFGTLTTQDQQDVNGCGKYKNGTWTVIIYRSLTTDDHDDVQFIPGGIAYFNVAVWDGGAKDRNGQKNISVQWHPIALEQISYR